jgi:hypothetical protein
VHARERKVFWREEKNSGRGRKEKCCKEARQGERVMGRKRREAMVHRRKEGRKADERERGGWWWGGGRGGGTDLTQALSLQSTIWFVLAVITV